MYFQKGALNTHKTDQEVKLRGPPWKGLQVVAIMACQYVMGTFKLVFGVKHLWRLLEKIAYVTGCT